jgi:3-hydroxyacyl-CoA dehydrogenase
MLRRFGREERGETMSSSKNAGVSASTSSYLTGNLGVIVIDHPPRNALTSEVRAGIMREMKTLSADPAVGAIAMTGANGYFLSGSSFDAEGQAEDISIDQIVEAIDVMDKAVLAVVTGPAEDDGLSIAVACDWRFASDAGSAGLPATMVGLVPTGGVTQRLPRLMGNAKALDLVARPGILAVDAVKIGLFDQLVDQQDIVVSLSKRPAEWSKRRLSNATVPASDAAEINQATKEALRRGKGSRSVAETVDLLTAAGRGTFAEGLEREKLAHRSSTNSPEAKALHHLAWAEAQSSVDSEAFKARSVDRVAVIGGGTMGSGIAISLAGAGLRVDIVEQTAEGAAGGLRRVEDTLKAQVKGGRLSEGDAILWQGRIATTDRWEVVTSADLVIEAAFEDMAVKRSIFERLDALAKPGAILATNTSYLDVDAIASFTNRPADVLGLHFFSPAHIMRLLEVVKAGATSPEVLATGMALGRRIGKLPIVAGVCDGFIGNRIFSVYRRHAEYLLEDGASPQEIDKAVQDFGFAMGPFAVADMSGLDIAWAMRKRRAATRDLNERYVAIPDRLCEAGRLGRKVGKGWYDYADGRPGRSAEVDALIDDVRRQSGRKMEIFTAEKIQFRLLSVMANEGARILDEGISARASDIDLVFVNGYGFPRLKGGPMFAADRAGLPAVLAEIHEAARTGGAGSEPSDLLGHLATSGLTFADWQKDRSGDGDSQKEPRA